MLKSLLQRLRGGPRPALATVLLREGRLFVQASDRTALRTAGFWVAAGPVASLAATAEPARVGEAVLDALARSRLEVPVPDRGTDLEAPLRLAAGVRSRRALMAGARACAVAREAGTLHIHADDDGAPKGAGGDRPPRDAAGVVRLDAAATADAVGRAVLAALAAVERSPAAPAT